MTLDKEKYVQVQEQDKQRAKYLLTLLRAKMFQLAIQAYKTLEYKKDVANYFSKYCIFIYNEMLRREKARMMFDDIDSDGESPTKIKKGRALRMNKGKSEENDQKMKKVQELHAQKRKQLQAANGKGQNSLNVSRISNATTSIPN